MEGGNMGQAAGRFKPRAAATPGHRNHIGQCPVAANIARNNRERPLSATLGPHTLPPTNAIMSAMGLM